MGWTVGEKAQRPLTLVKLCLPVCWRFGSSLSGPPSWRRFVDDAPTPPDRSRAKHCDSRHEKRTTDGGVCQTSAATAIHAPRTTPSGAPPAAASTGSVHETGPVQPGPFPPVARTSPSRKRLALRASLRPHVHPPQIVTMRGTRLPRHLPHQTHLRTRAPVRQLPWRHCWLLAPPLGHPR